MSHENMPINLKGPVDYLIFSSSTIAFRSLEQNSVIHSGVVVDRDNDSFTVCIDSNEHYALADFANDNFVLTAPYKSKLLSIDAKLLNGEKPDKLVFSLPLHGYLVERRKKQRGIFSMKSSQVTVNVESIDGQLNFKNTLPLDFSSCTVGLFLNRCGGLVLPGDIVANLVIFDGTHLVLESSGTVLLVDKTRHQVGKPENYFVLIELAHRGASSIEVGRRRRKSERIAMSHSDDAWLEFWHPLNPHIKITGAIADLSNSGCSIVLDADTCPIPFGLILSSAQLRLPGMQCLDVACRIMSIQLQEQDGESRYRVGMEFINISQQLFKALSGQVQTAMSAYLVDASNADYDRLWEFYFETGFIYGGKRRQIQKYADKIFYTYRCLLNNDTPLLKKILYKRDGEIRGHINAIRIFDHASIIQHLNALKTDQESAAQAVIMGITAHFMDNTVNQMTGNRYVMAYYRPDNLFPAAVFGGAERFINNSLICWATDYEFCLMEDDFNFSNLPEGVSYRDANVQDIEKLETLLIERGRFNLMRVEGLTRERLIDLAISRDYESIGLYRQRRVFVAEHARTGTRVYALCNYTSPGINLSELTNSTKFYFTGTDAEENALLADALAQPIRESYCGTAMDKPVLLLEPGQPIPKGFKAEKKYVEWVLDTAYVWKFKDATEAIFRNLKLYLRKHRPREAQLG